MVRRTLLPFVVGALVVGAFASLAGASEFGVWVWSVAICLVAVDLVAVTAARLREGRVAVDVVALVALVGSMVLDEPLAGVILALMVGLYHDDLHLKQIQEVKLKLGYSSQDQQESGSN